MALNDITDLRASVRDWAKRQSLGDALIDDFVTLTEAVFNYGERDDSGGYLVYPLRTREMETAGDVTVTDGQGLLPDDFLEAIHVRDPALIGEVGASHYVQEYVKPDWLIGTFPTGQNNFQPAYYTIIGDTVRSPTDVSVPYYARVPSLVIHLSNWLLTKAPNAYLYGCLQQYSIWDKDAEKVAGYRALMNNALGGLNFADVNSRAGSMIRRASMPGV